MHPVAFHIPWLNIPIYSYGVMMVVAFLATQWLAARLAKRVGIDPEIFVNLALYAMVAGVVGARLSHILENLPDFTRSDRNVWENLFAMINIRSGGLTFYGGFLLAFPVCLGYVMLPQGAERDWRWISAAVHRAGAGHRPDRVFSELAAVIRRHQCARRCTFPYDSNAYVDQFNNQVYGPASEKLDHAVPPQLLKETPTGVRLMSPDEFRNDPQLIALAAAERSNPVIPTQLYSTFTSLLMWRFYFVISRCRTRRAGFLRLNADDRKGQSRFLLELLRVEPPVIGRMSLSMLLGQMFFVVGAIMWFVFAPSSDQLPSAAQLAARQR